MNPNSSTLQRYPKLDRQYVYNARGMPPSQKPLKGVHTMETIKNIRVSVGQAIAILFAGSALALTGCNTVEGAGDDIEAAGDAISDTANDAKD